MPGIYGTSGYPPNMPTGAQSIIPKSPMATAQDNFTSSQPGYSAILSRLQGLAPPTAVQGIQTPTNPYNPQDYSKIFDVERSAANAQANTAAQASDEALARRFASMGMSNSGAAIAEQTANDQALNAQKAETQREIGSEQAQTESGQQFQAGQTQADRDLQAKEASLQASEFNTGEQEAEKQRQQEAELGVGTLQESGAEAAYNAAMNQYTAQHSGGLFGGGGFLGLGSWFCTERGKLNPLTDEDQRLLKLLLWHSKRRDRELTRFYLTEGSHLVRRARAQDTDWLIQNREFVDGILTLLSDGHMNDAFILYRHHFLHQLKKYWPDCRHPYFLKTQSQSKREFLNG